MDQYWCRFEFGEAYRLMEEGRRNYIIMVLVEKPTGNKLTPELKAYLKTFTYIDATNYEHDLETVRKRIRFAMPKRPLKQIEVLKSKHIYGRLISSLIPQRKLILIYTRVYFCGLHKEHTKIPPGGPQKVNVYVVSMATRGSP